MSAIKIEDPTEGQVKAWEYLLQQQSMVTSKICDIWNKGFDRMGVETFIKPINFEDLAIPHWRVLPIDGKSRDDVFYDRLSKSIINANVYMRDWSERDYLPTRCRWHDTFGHMPFLYNEQYSRIMRMMGMLGLMVYHKFGPDSDPVKEVGRLYWYTIEFGLIEQRGTVKAFGAGIISSPAELRHALSSDGLKKWRPFNELILLNDYEVEDFQTHYYVLKNLNQLEDFVINLFTIYF